MKRFLKSFILFLPFCFLFYYITLIAAYELNPTLFNKNIKFKKGAYGHMFTRLQEVKKRSKVDILFLGSSHTYRSFDPRVYQSNGWSSFNLGSSAQTPVQTEILIKRYINQLSPKVVVYEICPISLSNDGVESFLDIISNEDIDFEIVKSSIKQGDLIIFNTLLYSLFKQTTNQDNEFYENIKKKEDTYIKGGFVEKKLKYFKPEKNPKSNPKRISIYSKQLVALKRIVDTLGDKNIKLILVQAPVTSSFYNAFSGNSDFDKNMSSFGTYYNFNEMITLNDSLHFYDAHHLNSNGVKVFSEHFVKILEKELN